MNDPQANLSAFLYMIRSTEHVYPRDVVGDAAYSIFYGGSKFQSFRDHPVLTGEKKGVPLPDAMCAAAGLKPGCVSTAAGAYQLIKPTWVRLRDRLKLPDFSPLSQDQAAVALLDEVGALDLIYAGDIEGAIHKASKIWASLPGSTAQQNPKALAYALNRFDDGLAAG
jgi:lysozyme